MNLLPHGFEKFGVSAGLYLDSTTRAQVLCDWDDRQEQRVRSRVVQQAAQHDAWMEEARKKTVHKAALKLLQDILSELKNKKD